jgi:hypothetical protein
VITEETGLSPTRTNCFLRERFSHVHWRRTDLVDETAPWGPEPNLVDEKRFLSSEPATAADRAAWERAGFPTFCEYAQRCRDDSMRVSRTKFDLFVERAGRLIVVPLDGCQVHGIARRTFRAQIRVARFLA